MDDGFPYRVGPDDRIRLVSDAWLSFAIANGAPELTRQAVVGRSLWSFIDGIETRHLYQLIFASSRTRRREIAIPFRCDAPTRRRHMELRITPLADGGLDLCPRIVREEPHAYVALLDPAAPRSDYLVRICSWCKRVHVEPGGWVAADEAVRRLDLFDSSPLPGLTHGVCDRCAADLAETFEA